MSLLQQTLSEASAVVSISDTAAGLRHFLEPSCAAAIWRRQTPPDIQSWLDDLPPDVLPNGRVVLPADAVGKAVSHLCDMSGLEASPGREWLQNDIVALAEIFADLMEAPFLRVRLQAVATNACRKFHVDALTARLVCTYRGTGTQYGTSVRDQDPGRVFTVQTGAPILLRGTQWSETPPSGLRHRSPPIEGSGETRLLLVLDPITDPETEL